MVSKEEILSYISDVPSSNSTIQEAIALLNSDDLESTVMLLQNSPAIINYLQLMSHKGVVCIKDNNPNLRSMLIFFGSKKAKALLYTYMISEILPKKWRLFDMSNDLFFELSAKLTHRWEEILEKESPKNVHSYIAASSLIVASVAICDSIFGNHKASITPLLTVANIDFSTMLMNTTGMSLFDVAYAVGEKLGFEESVLGIIKQSASGEKSDDPEKTRLAKLLHILLFYTLSRDKFIKAGLNSFVKFNAESTVEVLDRFKNIIELED